MAEENSVNLIQRKFNLGSRKYEIHADDAPVADSSSLITSGAVEAALRDLLKYKTREIAEGIEQGNDSGDVNIPTVSSVLSLLNSWSLPVVTPTTSGTTPITYILTRNAYNDLGEVKGTFKLSFTSPKDYAAFCVLRFKVKDSDISSITLPGGFSYLGSEQTYKVSHVYELVFLLDKIRVTDLTATASIQSMIDGKQSTLVAGENMDVAPTANSDRPITSGGVLTAINNATTVPITSVTGDEGTYELEPNKYSLLGSVGSATAADNAITLSFDTSSTVALSYMGRFTAVADELSITLPTGVHFTDDAPGITAGHTYEFNILYDTCVLKDITYTAPNS